MRKAPKVRRENAVSVTGVWRLFERGLIEGLALTDLRTVFAQARVRSPGESSLRSQVKADCRRYLDSEELNPKEYAACVDDGVEAFVVAFFHPHSRVVGHETATKLTLTLNSLPSPP
jgi:hypothetical protein